MRTMTLILGLALMAGCQQKLAVDVVVTADPTANLADLNRFIVSSTIGSPQLIEALRERLTYYADDYLRRRSTEPADQPDPFTDSSQDFTTLQELATLAQARLNARGYISSGDPQLILRIDFVQGPYRYKVAQQIVPAASTDPTIGAMGSQNMYSGESPHDVILPGHEATVHASALAISIYASTRLESPIWSASIVTVAPTAFRGVAPLLLDELLREFPTPTNEPQRRGITVPD